ncbi:inositol monophosphatase family protein [Vulgatibacter sp.]|uniref:inositol monophosphatase family protein n=1 Tax=Vulgatibacter sp. TaxID=1971226 RepID=UPI0035676413
MIQTPSNEELLAAALAAAEAGGAVLAERFGGERRIEHKGHIDLVTDADQAAEEAVLAVIRERFPDHAILAEEEGASGASRFRWIVDPLDGTTNYAHGIPHFCTSVACEVDGALAVGAIVDPMRDERFTAATGLGAFCNGKRLQVTDVDRLDRAVLATGFPYWVQERPEEVLALFGAFLRRAQGVRRFGAAALDLAWLAAGRYDGFFELKLKPWDVAAGVVLVREAGGVVSAFDGGPFDMKGGDTLAAGPALHPLLVPVADAARSGW